MSVLLETSVGDIVVDLLTEYAPKLCENFLKLCKVKYYNFAPVHSVQKNFSFQTGDPLGPLSASSDGGTSIWGLLSGRPSDRAFQALFHPKLKHIERGTVSMATVPLDPAAASDPAHVRMAASQFLVTLGDQDTDYLDGKAAVFGKVVEGFDVLEKINDAFVDERGHPLVDVRIKHTIVLDDPYPDPPGLREPSASPQPTRAQLATVRIADEDALREDDGVDDDVLERRRRERDARAQALTLEMMGDLPFAEVRPPENVLFVCKLNPVTADADLELIFGRFGKILSCEVVRDHKTGDSLQYAFVEFEDKAACEAAYFKMQDVLIDDRRIHVDFSQSVSKLSDVWRKDANRKRRAAHAARHAGGWGGVQELEKRRQYRDEYEPEDDGYEMVHGEEVAVDGAGGRAPGAGGPGRQEQQRQRHRSRSRSPRGGRGPRIDGCRDRGGDGDENGPGRRDDRRRNDRRRGRHGDGDGEGERVGEREREREGDRERDGDRNRNRDRGRGGRRNQNHDRDGRHGR